MRPWLVGPEQAETGQRMEALDRMRQILVYSDSLNWGIVPDTVIYRSRLREGCQAEYEGLAPRMLALAETMPGCGRR